MKYIRTKIPTGIAITKNTFKMVKIPKIPIFIKIALLLTYIQFKYNIILKEGWIRNKWQNHYD